jgi:hypothetical protein
MDGNVNFTFPSGDIVVGEFEITPSQLTIYDVKSSFLWGALGGVIGALIGSQLAKREVIFELPIDDIKGIEIKRFRLSKNGCFITTKARETYVALFSHSDEVIDYLQRIVAQHV